MLFNLFIINLDNETERTLGTLADDSKLKGEDVMVESRTANQINFSILQN